MTDKPDPPRCPTCGAAPIEVDYVELDRGDGLLERIAARYRCPNEGDADHLRLDGDT